MVPAQHFSQRIQISLLIILIIYKAYAVSNCPERKTIFCYWASWASYRTGNGNHNIGHIIPELCTHVIFTFAGLDIHGKLASLDPISDVQKGGFKAFAALKKQGPSGCLKVILAIGGWGEGSEKYSLMAETSSNREKFAERVLRWLVFYGFDGIDIDWEYPTQRGGLQVDRKNFTELLKALKKKLAPRNKTLSAAVTGSLEVTKTAYEAEFICNELDFISIMGYDFQESNVSSIHSPLRPEINENRSTISNTIEYYKNNGCKAEKILLGVPAYGRTYNLHDTRKTQLGAPISGKGKEGTFTREKGFLGYNEICEMQNKQSGWKRVYLDKNSAVYAFNGKMWLSYDDERTISQKAEYVLKKKLGGMMLWSIDTDDFRGACSNVSYPLLKAMNKGLS